MKALIEPDIDLSIFEPYTINCSKCCGLCCTALWFSKSDGFPEDKSAGVPCKNLQSDHRCKIYSKLSKQKLKGCMGYDCFGAGQQVISILGKCPDWKSISSQEAEMIFQSYLTVLQIHQVLWYLTESSTLRLDGKEKENIRVQLIEGKRMAAQPLEALQKLDVEDFRVRSNKILKNVCSGVRTKLCPGKKADPVKNYMGKNMMKKNLSGKDFNMALLIAADLEGADLYGASFLGADMRDINIKNTDLSQCLFLTQMQINTAKGNQATKLPPYLHKPDTWE